MRLVEPPEILIFFSFVCLLDFYIIIKYCLYTPGYEIKYQVSCSHKKSKGTGGFEHNSLLYIGQCLVKQAPAVLLCPSGRDYVVCISDISESFEIVFTPHTLFGLQEANMF